MTFIEQTRKISAMLYKLIKSIKNKMLKVWRWTLEVESGTLDVGSWKLNVES
jgi:hypothetical protein